MNIYKDSMAHALRSRGLFPLVPVLLAAQAFGFSPNASASTIDLSDCGDGTACPYVTFGDANVYDLAIDAAIWDSYQGGGTGPGNPFYIPSGSGQIKDLVVPGTGANGQPVTTNSSGMDDAYATPNDKQDTIFFTTNKTAYPALPITGVSAPADPEGADEFPGDTSDTWDTTLTALSTFLNGETPVFFFNNNQVNSGDATNQDLAAWAQITLRDGDGGSTALYFDLTNQNSAYAVPGGGVLNGDPTAYMSNGSGPIAGDNNNTDYVLSKGQICVDANFNPQACDGSEADSIDNNLGADQAAYAIVVPELDALLAQADFGGYDSLSLDFRLGCDPNTDGFGTANAENCVGRSINNGFEQVFLGTATLTTTQVPEPEILLLIGIGLSVMGGMGMALRRPGSGHRQS